MEVGVPVVKPSLQIISNGGSRTIDFGSVATGKGEGGGKGESYIYRKPCLSNYSGDSLTKQLTVRNISDHSIQVYIHLSVYF